jgi:phospholipid/cholesterol/gamma-HCH transport system substrate-binding protein
MKINNETKVGIVTVVAIISLVLGFNFLKGKDLFRKTKKIYAVFSDAAAISKSNEVKINGLVIGNVKKLQIADKNNNSVLVTIRLNREVNIPVNSVAYVFNPIIGSPFIAIERGDARSFLLPGDTIKTRSNQNVLDDA